MMPALGTAYLGETFLGGAPFLEEQPFPVGLAGLVDSSIEEFFAKQGDTGPAWVDHLTWSDEDPVNLNGCTVELVLRSLSSRTPVNLARKVEVPEKTGNTVIYSPSAADTAAAGEYMACWIVTNAAGERMTFPTVGYRAVRIEPSLVAESQQLLSLTEVKDYLNIEEGDRAHDAKLLEHIQAVQPLIEAEVGPIIPTVYDEWFNGGHATIALPYRPNTGFGTSPIMRLLAASEYRGPVEYDLAIIATPAEGQVYSVMLDPIHGVVTRRSAGGGVIPFPFDPERGDQQVHLVYESGQERVPENVKMAAKEAIRVNYRSTQSTGKGRRAQADEEPGPAVPFYLPRKALELLGPNRRFPSFA
jgi:hypothetical protein